MINYKSSHSFWDKRGKSANNKQISDLSAAMLTPDNNFSKYRDIVEKKIFIKKIKLKKIYSVLDLGCGTGRWTLFLAPKVKNIVGVDFSESLIKIAKKNAKIMDMKNVKFFAKNIINYKTTQKFDLIYNSGTFQYLNDIDLNTLLDYLISRLKKNGIFVSRDTINLKERVQLSGKYEVIYRSEQEIISLYTSRKIKLISCFESLPFSVLLRLYYKLPNRLKNKRLLDFLIMVSIKFDSVIRYFTPVFYFLVQVLLIFSGKFKSKSFYQRHKFYIFEK